MRRALISEAIEGGSSSLGSSSWDVRGWLLSLDPRKRRATGMKKGMEESYIEDLANRDGPVHALAFREGAAKRWFRGACRPAIEPRNRQHRGADVLWISGRQHRWQRYA